MIDDIQTKQKKTKRPKSNLLKIGEVIPIVKESLGIEKSLKLIALKELWPLVTSFEIAKKSEPGYFDKENNLVIYVKSSALASELSMQKTSIFARLKEATKDTDIRFKDVRFITKSA